MKDAMTTRPAIGETWVCKTNTRFEVTVVGVSEKRIELRHRRYTIVLSMDAFLDSYVFNRRTDAWSPVSEGKPGELIRVANRKETHHAK